MKFFTRVNFGLTFFFCQKVLLHQNKENSSSRGAPSSSTRKLVSELTKFGMVDFIGSDAHRLDHRPPVIEEGAKRLLNLTSEEQAMWILSGNPKSRLLMHC